MKAATGRENLMKGDNDSFFTFSLPVANQNVNLPQAESVVRPEKFAYQGMAFDGAG